MLATAGWEVFVPNHSCAGVDVAVILTAALYILY
jgi:hypothetical protein